MKPKKTILIAEDNDLNREILKEILSAEYDVLEAENGMAALDLLQAHKDDIALVFLDVMMPVMDGYTFLNIAKNDPELSLIPIIVTTQNDSESDEVSALAHGATDFVSKPYRPRVILHRAASLIKLRETSAMVNQFQYDRLTGLYSKDFFYQKVQEQLALEPEKEYTIVCSNIENFKFINDIFGVHEGDRLLKEVARLARRMVGKNGFCGRYGADRFLFLQTREQEEKDRNNFGDVMESELLPLLRNVVMRWGIYEIVDRSISVERMCDRAMLAADSIKGQYHQFFAVYDDAMREELMRKQSIASVMGTALREGQFDVYFHPKYNLKTGAMAGAEALVRWIHPEWGMIPCGEFIPQFEKNGFISRLDEYVWEKVCAELKRWRELGYPEIPVSVNVSRADIYHMNLVDTLTRLTVAYGIPPDRLHLEITESAYTENPGQITDTMKELQEHGFIIEMDDFGSGFSSLNMFSQMKADILKLDMAFVRNETAKSANQSILNDVIRMAHRMCLDVVAEGVERKDQVERLRDLECDYVQGYFFAKPMPSAEFEELLKKAGTVVPALSGRSCELSPRKLLLADEDEAYRQTVRDAFAGEYTALEATDAEKGSELLLSSSKGEIAAVILSATLPENGAERLLNLVRQSPAYWRIPVLCTIPTPCEERSKELDFAMGADDFLCKCHPVADLRKRVERLIEIEDMQEREIVLQDEASHDPLTGLLNRRGLSLAMASMRLADMPIAVCMFDLDDLKGINDTFGHKVGDRVIRAFSDLIHKETRNDDILCRYGGDEFIVILKHIGDPEVIARKGNTICRKFHESMAEEPFPVHCSGGIVMCDTGEISDEELIERADQAMYRAKREDKGQCCLWEEDLA
ncbi:MAG: EAL domain-containing protein [Clostridia bacterium]